MTTEILHTLVEQVAECIVEKLAHILQINTAEFTKRKFMQSNENMNRAFDDFAQYYFNTFRWRKVSTGTKRADL